MAWDLEKGVLDRAVKRGLLKLDFLVEQGILDTSTVDRLMEEVEESDESNIVLTAPLSPSRLESGPSFGRYQDLQLLGEGGMSRVFKAYDSILQRFVAVKVLRINDPDLRQRLLREARAQARIHHPNICKVHEAGEDDGMPYIVMEFIEGKNLKQAKAELTLEQKVKVVQQVARAVHAAHRVGLIHRDIKPANIMVEQTEDGHWMARVLDFGIAREMQAPGLTMTGMPMGTPLYMSPEQARGETRQLDRRSDVYSMGVTLYELLAGMTPFEDTNSGSVMKKVLEEDPLPLRQKRSDIPVDLETIVMKCLEKEIGNRYESAKALAEDLGRFLDGEPIQARRAGWLYRIRKKLQKHRLLILFGCVAFLLVLIFAAAGLHARWTAAKQAELAQTLGQEVKDIEWLIRVARMSPLHDIRDDQNKVRDRMKVLEAQIPSFGKSGYGPLQYALGRGYLTLREYSTAGEHLEKAWQSEYRQPEVAYALGLAMAGRYGEELQDAARIGDKHQREIREKAIDATLKDPALRYLKLSSPHLESSDYLKGLISFYEKRYEEALYNAANAVKEVPWLYEARSLEGEIYLARGRENQERGKYEAALQDYESASSAYEKARRTGPSDANVYEGLCESWLRKAAVEDERGGSPEVPFRSAQAECELALKADPQSAEAYLKLAWGHSLIGKSLVRTGGDPLPELEAGVTMIRQALQVRPQDSYAYHRMGAILLTRGQYEKQTGADPRPSLAKALKSFQEAIDINPNDSRNELGVTHNILAYYAMEHGIDSRPELEMAIAAFHETILIDPENSFAYVNLGNAYNLAGTYEMERGVNPKKLFEEGAEWHTKALQFNPNEYATHENLGHDFRMMTWYEVLHGLDPSASISRAIEQYTKSLALNPQNAFAFGGLSELYVAKSRYEQMRGLDPQPSVQSAVENSESAIRIKPDYPSFFENIGNAYKVQAKYLVDHNMDPAKALAEGRKSCRRAIGNAPDYYPAYLIQGDLELLAARWEIFRHRSPQRFFDAGQAALTQALKWNSRQAEVYRALAELHLHLAEWHGGWQEMDQALNYAQKALSINPDLAEALLIRGECYLLSVRSQKDAALRSQAGTQAMDALDKALTINPYLAREYGKLVKESEAIQGK